mgnify:CR=1 FL=1
MIKLIWVNRKKREIDRIEIGNLYNKLSTDTKKLIDDIVSLEFDKAKISEEIVHPLDDNISYIPLENLDRSMQDLLTKFSDDVWSTVATRIPDLLKYRKRTVM